MQLIRTLPVLLAVTFILPACEEDIAFYIYQNQVPEEGCTISTTDKIYRPEGLLDVSLGMGYWLFPLLYNDLPSVKGGQDLSDTPDPNTLHLREYWVDLDLGGIPKKTTIPGSLTSFTYPTSGMLMPGDKRASVVKVIPDDLAARINVPTGARPMIMARIQAVASTGDDVLESMPFYYPIHLCNGCLVTMLNSCPTDFTTSIPSNVCGIPQDVAVACCSDPQRGVVCLPSAN